MPRSRDPFHVVQVQASWCVYQQMVAAYRHRGRAQGHVLMHQFITSISSGVLAALSEIRGLGRNLRHYIARSLLESRGFKPQLHLGLR